MNKNIPNQQQVKDIYKDTYLFYLKFLNTSTDKEFQEMIRESNDLYKKYPFELCQNMLIDICSVIGEYERIRDK